MPSASNIVGFTLLALVIILVPGPSVLYTIGRALILGTRAAVLSVLGNALGVGLQIVVIAVGLGALIAQSELLFFGIRLFGAGMITYLGLKAFLDRKNFDLEAKNQDQSAGSVFRQSIVVGISNAKTFVFFLGSLPLFVNPELGSPVWQMLFLGVIFSAIGIASDSVYAIAAGQARDWLSSSANRLANFRGAGGVALTLLGLYMLYEAITH
ncbi:LysE family translocator [Aquiluna borgnonia]|uniref:LysE family translocator n=1 Tax=Aquiluna borgnonia TaxID=2499157 RepID=A0A7D4TK71_9MICO|nr:LysE family translocator [Aquiluna borgnonia]QKJ25112.1 LysE family translocator [Aquiluna borgnonia]